MSLRPEAIKALQELLERLQTVDNQEADTDTETSSDHQPAKE